MSEADILKEVKLSKGVEETLVAKSPQRRAEIASDLGCRLNSDLSPLERKVAEAVAHHLAEDAIEMVRVALAKSVRHSRFLPKDTAFKLAYDVESVSVPFLKVTEVFSEEELCEIARQVSAACQRAIGERQSLSAPLCRVLCEQRDASLAQTVLENEGANIDEACLLKLLEDFAGNRSLLEAMAKRQVLPASVSKLLIDKVSDAALSALSERYGIGTDFAAPFSREAGLEAQFKLSDSCNDQDLIDFLTILNADDRLTANSILRSIRDRRLNFFEGAIAVRSGLPLAETRERLKDTDEKQLQSLCAKANLPLALWSDILKEVRQVNQQSA